MGKPGPETRLSLKCKKDAKEEYSTRLVIIKYHGDESSEAGVSDFLGTLDGKFFAIEMKAPETYNGNVERAIKKGPTLKQRIFLMRVRKSGGCWAVCATREQFLETMRAIEQHEVGQTFGPMPWLDLADFPTGEPTLCTCSAKHGCEWDTEYGCLYCRTAPRNLPCPNIEGL